MFILEQQFGNDGYAFWFKTLEILGETEGHCIDCKEIPSWKYLLSRTHLDNDKAEEILNLLADLEAIDSDLWKIEKKIWSDHFIENLSFAYRNREVTIPIKPIILRQESGICRDMPDNDGKKSANEMKVNEMKVNETKDTPLSPQQGESQSKISKRKKSSKPEKIPWPDDFAISDRVRVWAKENNENHLEEHFEAFKLLSQARGYTYANWDAAFINCIKNDWGNVKANGEKAPKCSQPGISSWLAKQTAKETLNEPEQ